MDYEKELTNAIRDGLREGVKQKLSSNYGSNPIGNLIESVIKSHDAELRSLLNDSFVSAIGDAKFREEIQASVRHILAKTLVSRFGGELEKQVNVLKSDPTTRARITIAIEEIVKSKL